MEEQKNHVKLGHSLADFYFLCVMLNRIIILFLLFSFGNNYILLANDGSIDNKVSGLDSYFETSAGIAHFYLRDQATSPLIYSGLNFVSQAKLSFLSEKMRHGFEFYFSYGNLNPYSSVSSANLENMTGEINHYYVRLIKKFDDIPLSIFAGASINIRGGFRDHSRFTNNSFSFDQTNSLNLNLMAEYPFNVFGRDFLLSYRSFVPVYAFIVRPAFASSTPSGFTNGSGNDFADYLNSGFHATINSFFRWNNSFELQYKIRNSNRIKLSYSWDYYKIGGLKTMESASHYVMFGTMFSF